MRHLACAATLALPALALAQPCSPGFQPGGPGAQGIFDSFSAYVQPMTEYQGKLIVGGAFSAAGPVATNCIGQYDLATNTWSALGAGANLGNTNGFGAALATYSMNGTQYLIFGGSFASMKNAGGVQVPNTTSLAAWNGTQWSTLTTNWQPSTGRSVWTLLDWQSAPGVHRLLAGGGFPNIGAATAAGIAYYDGEAWNNVGGPTDTGIAGSFSPVVFCSAVYAGSLYIGGRFDSVSGVAAPNMARWSGTAWQRPGILGNGGAISDIDSLCVFDDGTGAKLYAGGYTMSVSGQPTTVAAFNGTVWTRIGQNLGGRGTGLAVYDDGSGPKLYLGMTADANQHYIYRLENNAWVVVDGGVSVPISGNFPSVFGVYTDNTTLYVGGDFQVAGGEAAYGIAQYTGCLSHCGSADFNGDGDVGTDQDLDAFFACLSGLCCPTCGSADFNGDGDIGTDQDIDAFFRVLAGGSC
jgi:hypothetical protein